MSDVRFKMRVEDVLHSSKLQQHLFSLGYKWPHSQENCVFIPGSRYPEGIKSLYIHEDMTLGWGAAGAVEENYWNRQDVPEMELVTVYQLQEVPKEKVTILGKTYLRKDVEKLLANAKEVV